MRRLIAGVALFLAGCATTYPIQAGDLDGGQLPDKAKLVSQDIPTPTDAQKAQTVVVAAHGYTATTFEIHPVADYLRQKGMLVSEVLLGAHGTSIQDFEKSTWKTWQAPIIQEYNALKAKGYQHIVMLGTSTGGPLILQAIDSGAIAPAPRRIALVAPLVEINNKLAGYAGILDFFGYKYIDTKPTGDSVGHWYRFRPASTVSSLVDLTEIMKARLRAGITLPDDTKTLIIQSKQDSTVDPVSADLLKAGLKGGEVRVNKVDSTMHIPIWPDGVGGHTFTPQEDALRTQLMEQIAELLAS